MKFYSIEFIDYEGNHRFVLLRNLKEAKKEHRKLKEIEAQDADEVCYLSDIAVEEIPQLTKATVCALFNSITGGGAS